MSLFLPAEKVKNSINRAGSISRPFLFAVDYEIMRGLFIENPLKQSNVLFRIGAVKNYREIACNAHNTYLRIKNMFLFEKYSLNYSKVMEGMLRGDSYLANLTAATEVELSISLREVLALTQSPFGICVNNNFVSFSPERFVRIENGVISSCPMKGTIDASLPDAKGKIMKDYKESCEHNTIVDLIRNDLGIVSQKVWVEKFRYIDRIEADRINLLQVSSDIRGLLPENYKHHLGDIIFSLLPAGSISGAPKQSTVKLISEAEGDARGFYTGIFGYFDGSVLDSAVLIRYIERDLSDRFFYRSGGGITVNSCCRDEYRELIEKVYLPLKKA